MKTLSELKEMSREQLIVSLWDLIGNSEEKALANLVQEIAERRKSVTDASTIIVFDDHYDISFYLGRSDTVIDSLLHCVRTICDKCGIKMETLLGKIIEKIQKEENNESDNDDDSK